jgi:hypothetical protein
MKKSKIFMAAGALTLAITAAFATKVNKKFTQVASAYFSNSGAWYITGAGGTGGLLTTKGTHQLNMVIYYTKSGTTQLGGAAEGGLLTVVNTSNIEKVFYK